jgi:PAS domain S-box-containing protein
MAFTAPLLSLGAPEEAFRLLVESVQDYAIFILDPRGIVMTWNAGARRIKGYEASEIIGRSFELFYTESALERGWPREELRRAVALGRFEDEGWRVRRDGTTFWASVVITALRAPDGALVGFAKVTRDLTERRAYEEALRRSEEQLRLMIEAVKDYAIFMLDTGGRVLSWNGGAQTLLGYTAVEAVGHGYDLFFTARDNAEGRPQAEMTTSRLGGRIDTQGWRLRKDGSVFWSTTTVTPVLDQERSLRGYAVVMRDLSDQRRMLELEQATRRTNDFLAVLAHELRNPLAPIRNAVSALKLADALAPGVARARDIIDRQLHQLTRLVDDLLDVARISSGKIQFQIERLDWRDIVNAAVEAVRPLALARRQRFESHLPEHPVPVMGDPARLVQALQNVVHNAVKYTPEGGAVRLDVHVADGACVTHVTDSGRGIAPEALERIFQMFVQEDPGGTPRADAGLGIGLNLARSLVEGHGGRLSAQSPGVGQGSTFTLVLPLGRGTAVRPPAPPSAVPAPHTMLRALVVDDNRDSADTMADLLTLWGHNPLTAYGAEEAVAAARGFDPQVVFLDLNLPDGDGFTVLERMRAEMTQPPLFAAMTGYGQESDRARTRDAGFALHLVKPVVPEQVQEALDLASRRVNER